MERDKGFVLLPTLQPCAAAATGSSQRGPRAPSPRRRGGASPPLSAPGDSNRRGRASAGAQDAEDGGRGPPGPGTAAPTTIPPRHGQPSRESQALHDGNPSGERPERGRRLRLGTGRTAALGTRTPCPPKPHPLPAMGNGMSQILPGLYLGNFIDAKDLEQLSRNKITHIVSIHESPQPLLQDITYLRIPLPDTPEANIKRHFKECISFIHQCRLHGGNCLVHCLAGISRSTTVVVAYVMVVTELSYQEVLDAVRTIRPVANPNPGFRQQLAEFNGSAARKVRRHLKQRYGTSPFNDEEEIKALLPAGRGGPSRTEGPLQGLVPRARDIRTTTPFLLRVKRTFSCIPTCLK
uniref:Dual specificity protein phosphatase 15 n=1 Tax=Calidris pygmaea TaxID=425635 RepID=A0A8C3KNI9_9CHAR